MNRQDRQFVTRIFLVWILAANLLAYASPVAVGASLSHWLGDPWLWATIIPALCLAMLNPLPTAAALLTLLMLPVLATRRTITALAARQSLTSSPRPLL